MKSYRKIFLTAGCIILFFIVVIIFLKQSAYIEQRVHIDAEEWKSLVLFQVNHTDYYKDLLRYGIEESIKIKLSDVDFLEKYGLFIIKELYGPFRSDYKIAIDKGDHVLFVFEEKIEEDIIGEEKSRHIILEKKTGRIISVLKTRF